MQSGFLNLSLLFLLQIDWVEKYGEAAELDEVFDDLYTMQHPRAESPRKLRSSSSANNKGAPSAAAAALASAAAAKQQEKIAANNRAKAKGATTAPSDA